MAGSAVIDHPDILFDGMLRIPGGTFRMGSDRHYPEEAPAHRVTVDEFLIDRTPVTNRQFKQFVRAIDHVTFAEIPPDPKNYPGALPHMLYAGSLVFSPPVRAVDLSDWSQWWQFMKGADWRHPHGPKSNINVLDNHPVVHIAYSDALAIAPAIATPAPARDFRESPPAAIVPPIQKNTRGNRRQSRHAWPILQEETL